MKELLLALLLFVGCKRPSETNPGFREDAPNAGLAPGRTSRTSTVPGSPEAPSSTTSQVASLGALLPGDLVFQTSRSAQSLAVQLATRSPLSHMGVVLPCRRS